MTPRLLGSLLAVLLAGSLLAACEEVLSEEANARLEPLVLSAIDAAEAGDLEGASETLQGVRDEVDRLLEEGQLDAEKAERIVLAADQADALLALLEEDELGEEPRDTEPADERSEPEPGDDGPAEESDDPPGRDANRGEGRSGEGPPDHANDGRGGPGNGGNSGNSGNSGNPGGSAAPGERGGGAAGAGQGGGDGGGNRGGSSGGGNPGGGNGGGGGRNP